MDEDLETSTLERTVTSGLIFLSLAAVGKLLLNVPIEHTFLSLLGLAILYKLSVLVECFRRDD